MDEINAQLGAGAAGKAALEVLDLASLKSVSAFAAAIAKKHSKRTLDILVLNVHIFTPFSLHLRDN